MNERIQYSSHQSYTEWFEYLQKIERDWTNLSIPLLEHISVPKQNPLESSLDTMIINTLNNYTGWI